MLTNYSDNIFNVIQFGLYEAQHYVAGDSKATSYNKNNNYNNNNYDGSLSSDNVSPTFISRLTGAFIVAPLDLCLEVVRHVAIAVESAVFGAISVLAFIIGVDHAGRYALINFDQAIYNLVLAVCKAATLPFIVLPQMFYAGFMPQYVASSHFMSQNKDWLTPDPKYVKIPDSEGMQKIEYPDFAPLYEHNANRVQMCIYSCLNYLANNELPLKQNFSDNDHYRPLKDDKYNTSPVIRQLQPPRLIDNNNFISTALLGPVIAVVDTVIEITKPLFLAITTLTLATLELAFTATLIATSPITLMIAAPILMSDLDGENKSYLFQLLTIGKAGFVHLSLGSHYLAQTISRAALSPITLVSQILAAWIDPQNVEPSYKGLYATRCGDTRTNFSEICLRVADVNSNISENRAWRPVDSYEAANAFCKHEAQKTQLVSHKLSNGSYHTINAYSHKHNNNNNNNYNNNNTDGADNWD